MAATPIPTKLSTILKALKARLIAKMGFPQERVLISLQALNPPFRSQAEQYCILFPSAGHFPEEIFEGSGRVETRTVRRTSAVLWTRSGLDEEDRDEIRLTDQSLGHLDFEHKMFDALIAFQPVDSQNNWLVYQPIKPQAISAPMKAQDILWIASEFQFDVDYILQLDQSYQ